MTISGRWVLLIDGEYAQRGFEQFTFFRSMDIFDIKLALDEDPTAHIYCQRSKSLLSFDHSLYINGELQQLFNKQQNDNFESVAENRVAGISISSYDRREVVGKTVTYYIIKTTTVSDQEVVIARRYSEFYMLWDVMRSHFYGRSVSFITIAINI
jgi:hypothetical protein